MAQRKRARRGYGSIRKLPSGRYQAHVTGPDLSRHMAADTFDTRADAEGWLSDQRNRVQSGEWAPAKAPVKALTFAEYAEPWLASRLVRGRPLRPRTTEHYRAILDTRILPTLGEVSLRAITADEVARWYAGMGTTTPTYRAHAYGLLRSILASAVEADLISRNPARLRGAGRTERVHDVRPLTLLELEALTVAMPAKLQALVQLAAWCGLRFGEATELRRKDIDLEAGIVHVHRAVVRVGSPRRAVVGEPKSAAGRRDVAIPPHLIPLIDAHLAEHVEGGREALLFPATNGEHLSESSLRTPFHKAREVAGRPELRFHDLRHTGAVLAAVSGATLAELMGRLGHSTPQMAMRYQHVGADRDRLLAAKLSALAREG